LAALPLTIQRKDEKKGKPMSLTFLDLKDIAEREIELVNPTSPEKIVTIGRVAGMSPGQRVVDFGCGYAEPLVLWAENFGLAGVGV
jgi:hypothetical protein